MAAWEVAAEQVRSLGRRITPSMVNRAVGAVLLVPSASVLLLAGWLTPSPTGVGTHLQLGLGSCVMLSLTGFPCPMCGMTTTFSLMSHGRPLDALLNQPFGVVLYTLTVFGAAVGLGDLVLSRGFWRRTLRWIEPRESTVAALLLLGMGLGWVYKILLVRGILHLHA